MRKCLLLFILVISSVIASTQTVPVKDVLKPNREKLFRNLVNNTIHRNLSDSLQFSTEDQWISAFQAILLTHYQSPWIDQRIQDAVHYLPNSSSLFQRELIALIHEIYPAKFTKPIRELLPSLHDARIFSLSITYLFHAGIDSVELESIRKLNTERLILDPLNPYLLETGYMLLPYSNEYSTSFYELLKKDFLPENVLLISFQRKSRNFPGIIIIRDSAGNFLRNSNGGLEFIPQLARSLNNLPGIFSNGNTPEGIFRMDGFDRSQSSFIGPTRNVQLTMPFEYKANHFFQDSSITDSTWKLNRYTNLLPKSLRSYHPLLGTYFAGKVGRNGIIAHGSTVNPDYYTGKSYYPLTPTEGCLTVKERWNDATGYLMESDQEKLVNHIIRAGGPHGYLVVINLDDQEKAVSISEIEGLFKKASDKNF